jgi:cytochrome c-type biogenesis protein CcmE
LTFRAEGVSCFLEESGRGNARGTPHRGERMAKSNKSVYLIALLLFLAGFGWLVFSGLSQNSVYFLNVSEALAMEPTKLSSARLFGTVDQRELDVHKGAPGVTFRLLDKDDAAKAIVVDYKGAVPDTFKPGVEVIVEGGMTAPHRFGAATLMTKCPSKYQKENREKNS